MTDDSEIVDKLVATKHWSREAAQIVVRAKFKCEYCDAPIFGSVDSYIWDRDHIVPTSAGGPHTFENWAASCFQCNRWFKAKFNPGSDPRLGPDATREQRIEIVRTHVAAQRSEYAKQLEEDRAIVARVPA